MGNWKTQSENGLQIIDDQYHLKNGQKFIKIDRVVDIFGAKYVNLERSPQGYNPTPSHLKKINLRSN